MRSVLSEKPLPMAGRTRFVTLRDAAERLYGKKVSPYNQATKAQAEAFAQGLREIHGNPELMQALNLEWEFPAGHPKPRDIFSVTDPDGRVIQYTGVHERAPQAKPPVPEGGKGGGAPTEAAAGFNPIAVAKKADDLNIPENPQGGSFTAERKPPDMHIGHALSSPRSIRRPNGTTILAGAWERLAGKLGAKASDLTTGAEQTIETLTRAWGRTLDIIEHRMGEAAKRAGKKADAYAEDFIDLVERKFDDPLRKGANAAESELLALHDSLTKNFRDYITANYKALKMDPPEFITDQGYMRHLFLGDLRIKIAGQEGVITARTFAEAQKIAADILAKNPAAKITATGKVINAGDKAVRLSAARYFKMIGKLEDTTSLTKADLMEGFRGIIGQKGTKTKFAGYLQHRTKVKGWSKDYMAIMRSHASQVARTQSLTYLQRKMEPVIQRVERGIGTPNDAPLPGVAESMRSYMDTLWGTPTKAEIATGRLIEQTPVLRNYVAVPTLALRGLARKITDLQRLLKLEISPASSWMNDLQSYQTLWPLMKTKDFVALRAQIYNPKTIARLRDMGVFRGATKVEGSAVTQSGKFKGPFALASDRNRAMGYLFGEQEGRRLGMTEKMRDKNGKAWAEYVEFNSSQWNAAPLMRGWGGKVLFQFKGFPQKYAETLGIHPSGFMQEGTILGKGPNRAARIAKSVAATTAIGGLKAPILIGKSVIGYKVFMALKDGFVAAGMSEENANTAATGLWVGAPGLIGAELSGRVAILDEPRGEGFLEKAGNFVFGPTVGNIATVADNALPAMGIGKKPPETMREYLEHEQNKDAARNRIWKALTPLTRTVDTAEQMIRYGADAVDVKVGDDRWIRLTPQEAILMSLGYQPRAISEFFERQQSGIKTKTFSKIPKKR